MASVDNSSSYELRVLQAAADGVEPALLLIAPGSKAEYLFNVPDGFSRLALEHKSTPSSRLSCVLLTSLSSDSTGGLGGLFLRLKHDGHGQLQIIGPRGTAGIVHSLRHICRWQHPKVFVSECCDNRPLPVFEDEHIVIVPLLAGDQPPGCPWCLYGSTETSTVGQLKNADIQISHRQNKDGCSSSESSTSSASHEEMGATVCSDFLNSRTERQIFNLGLGMVDIWNIPAQETLFGKHDEVRQMDIIHGMHKYDATGSLGSQTNLHKRRKGGENASLRPPLELYSDLFRQVKQELGRARRGRKARCKLEKNLTDTVCIDDSCSDGQKRSSLSAHHATSVLFCEQSGSLPLTVSNTTEGHGDETLDENFCSGTRGFHPANISNLKEVTSKTQRALARQQEDSDSGHETNVNLAGEAVYTDLRLEYEIELSPPIPVHFLQPYSWLVHNSRLTDLPPLNSESNPVFEVAPAGHVDPISVSEKNPESSLKQPTNDHSPRYKRDTVLGYVCYLRKLKKAIVIVDCPSEEQIGGLVRHPILNCPHRTATQSANAHTQSVGNIHNIAAVIHLSSHSITQSNDYGQWIQSSGIMAPHILTKGLPSEFGFLSSLVTLTKLNSIHGEIFPLPPNREYWPRSMEPLPELSDSNERTLKRTLCMQLTFQEDEILAPDKLMDLSRCPNLVKPRTSEGQKSHFTSFNPAGEVGQKNIVPWIPLQLTANNSNVAVVKEQTLQQKNGMLDTCTSLQGEQGIVCATPVELDLVKSYKREPMSLERISCSTTGRDVCCNQVEEKGLLGKVSENSDNRIQAGFKLEIRQRVPEDSMDYVHHDTNMQKQEIASTCELDSDFQLTFLGTGCAEPSKKRGSSGILLQIRGAQGAMLLDAGEGVSGQLVRRFGKMGAEAVISTLQCLWISHKHGDHALGILSILQARTLQEVPLVVIGPRKVGQWLSEISAAREDTDCCVPPFTFFHFEEVAKFCDLKASKEEANQFLQLLHRTKLRSMRMVRVYHCFDACGIVLNGTHGWRVVYSGDTRPCKQLIQAGQNCTVLIHEATFEDSLIEQAKLKRHCTVTEAVEVGLQMGASHIILTHFSQRYPEMVAMCIEQYQNVSVAFDGMVVPSRLLGCLSKMLPLITAVFHKVTGSFKASETSQPMLKGPPIAESTLPLEVSLVQSRSPICSRPKGIKESPGVKHIRWSINCDDCNMENQLHGHEDETTTIRWSSDSEGEETHQESRHIANDGSPVCPRVLALKGGVSTVSFLKLQSSTVQRADALMQGELKVLHQPVEETAQSGSKVSMSNTKDLTPTTGIGVAVESFLQQAGNIARSRAWSCQYEVKGTSCGTTEVIGPQGSKHTRWIDSDDECC